MKTYKIAHLYYDLMNLYGENGNIRYLYNKLQEQKINPEIHFLTLNDKIEFEKYDFYYIGMGSEENQKIVLEDLKKYQKELTNAINNSKFFLITGNALELFGKRIESLDGSFLECLSIFDFKCREENERIVGEQNCQTPLINQKIIGFQNRPCKMTENSNYLFEVTNGCGFNKESKYEGIHQNNFYGTYLIGPLLVRNPYFCDYLVKEICKAINIKYQKPSLKDPSYKAYNEYLHNFINQ